MSDQNVVKEGWVQKRGEPSLQPPKPHLLAFHLHPILFCPLTSANLEKWCCRRRLAVLSSTSLLLFLWIPLDLLLRLELSGS